MPIILFVIAIAFFMEAIDSTILNTAIPAISHSLKIDPLDLKVGLLSYLLSLSIFIPISGWLADKFGVKKIFILALFIFTASSLWCGFATNLTELVIARFAQGIGGALNLPVGRLIILRTFGRHKLVSAMTRIVMVGSLGLMLGPVLGGVITQSFSWHWIFWINIPVGIIAMSLAYIYLTEEKQAEVHALDKMGFVLFGLALAGLTFGLSALSENTVNISVSLSIILISLFLLVLYYLHSYHLSNPIIKTDLLKLRTFRVSTLGNLFSRLGFGGVPFLIPLMLQVGLGYSPSASGFLLAPTAIGILLVKPFLLPILNGLGYKRLLIINTVFAGLSLWLFMLIDTHTSIYLIGLSTFLYGFIVSLQYSAMNSIAYADLNHADLAAASSIMSTLQQFSMAFGVAACALLVRIFSSLLTSNNSLTPLTFHYTFFVMGIITMLSTSIFLFLKKEDGEEMISGKEESA